MSLLRSIRPSGFCRILPLLVVVAACRPPGYGFAGGGLPGHIRTMAIQPFDNETPTPELQKEIFETMRKELQPRLGVRDAPEGRADAVVRGVVRAYDVDVPTGYSANPSQAVTSRRRLQITLDVQIVDQTNGKTIWEKKGLRAEGEYAERDEVAGRRDA
ncbi:MAG: LPS assembly lipoprotein LptE, partial [bacterium]